MQSAITFVLDGRLHRIDFRQPGLRPTTTVLQFLRSLPTHKGVKEGCAEGDCGACTVVFGQVNQDGRIRYRSVDSCLVFLPMLHGKQLITVENVCSETGALHPVQQAMVDHDGSQCGFCTPGFIMSMLALYKSQSHPSRHEIDDALTGNLCRCTGYRPIIAAAAEACAQKGQDHFSSNEAHVAALLKSIPSGSVHIQTEDQHYHRPATLAEAVSLKHRYPEALIISGATDVALRVTKRHELLPAILDISGTEELREVSDAADSIHLGAGMVLSDVMGAIENTFPALHSMLSVFGSQQIRNLATIGGNLGTASPIGDTLPVLIAYGASVILESINGRREVAVADFITGYRKTVRRPDEIITRLRIPKPHNGIAVRSYKVSKRKDLDISTVSAGFRLELTSRQHVQSVVLAFGGMAESVKRASRAETALIGRPWVRETIEEVMPLLANEFSPISDARAGAGMRRIAASNLLLKFWTDTTHHS